MISCDMAYPKHLCTLLEAFKLLPGVGTRTAERYVFHLLGLPSSQVEEFGGHLQAMTEKLKRCSHCRSLADSEGCRFCDDPRRDRSQLCVLSNLRDVYAMEQTGEYRGLYHVLEGLLSPLRGRGAPEIGLDVLRRRVETLDLREVILAFDSTVDGDATALTIKELLPVDLSIYRLAHGMPMGSPLEYVDEGTLALALAGRQKL